MRRAFLCFAALTVVRAFAACSSDDDHATLPDASASRDSGGVDASLIGDSSADVQQDADPGPGNVCGDATGLQANAEWPVGGACPTRAGYSADHTPASTKVNEIAKLAGGTSGPALAADGTLWIGATDGTVYLLTAGAGAVQVQRTLPGAVKGTPAIDKLGNAVVACEDGNLYSLSTQPDPDAGIPAMAAVNFQVHVGPSDASPVIGSDGTIYIGTNDGNLVAVAVGGTAVKWSKPTGDTAGNSPAIGQNGVIYVGSTDHSLRAFNPDGSLAWQLDLGAAIDQSPAVGGDGTIYVGTADSVLHAVTTDGKSKWTYAGTMPFVGTPAVYAGQVYVASVDKRVHAVGVIDGSGRWTFTTLGTPTTPLVDGDNHIDFGSSDSHIYVLTTEGTLYVAGTTKGAAVGGAALGKSGIYVVTPTGLDVMGP